MLVHPIKEKSVVHFNLNVDFNWLYYSKEGYGRATNGVMTQHEVKCTIFLQMMNASFPI